MLLYMESNTDEDGNGDSPVPLGVKISHAVQWHHVNCGELIFSTLYRIRHSVEFFSVLPVKKEKQENSTND